MKKLWLAAAVLAISVPVFAQTSLTNAPSVQMAAFTDPSNVRADLARIDAAMNATKSFSGRFVQYYSDGSVTGGKVYLSRPENLRFEYDDPNPLLIVVDNGMMVYHDKKLETYDRGPLSATPLSYFLKEDLNLAEDTEVVALQKTNADWRVTARDGSGNMEGAITMVLDAQTLALKEWIITDDFGGETRVVLSDLSYNARLDPRLFILREDSNRRDRR
ncbi:outer membrane lipoprotein-sorting protein [Litorimonas taeanensis]|uniref:Outer membrane lipoprotein-sorting protein n=1 Tax=Litorimonas taeanensis TaxID=568099 RepID=A0A420WFE8_9PROT|nr:outer membrane lipoprotein carrier protein LolA [Litorimonas taeanensis]RKQ69696.1 outer membrane lipoprotein-sorting protein [Litorimonas taeanensis]